MKKCWVPSLRSSSDVELLPLLIYNDLSPAAKKKAKSCYIRHQLFCLAPGDGVCLVWSAFLDCKHSQENQRTKTRRPCWWYWQQMLMRNPLLKYHQYGRDDVTCNRRILQLVEGKQRSNYIRRGKSSMFEVDLKRFPFFFRGLLLWSQNEV